MAAIRTPIGTLRPTRLQFGLRNAGIYTQGTVRRVLEDELPQYAKDHMVNIADDFTGFVETAKGSEEPDWDGLVKGFVQFLDLCVENNWSLAAHKTVFGAAKCDFFGHTLSAAGVQMADHQLAPIERMVAPQDISELRRVLGLMVQHKDRVAAVVRDHYPLPP
mgnify:FL=1